MRDEITFDLLKKIEPRLAMLEAEILLLEVGQGESAETAWYGHGVEDGFKQRLQELVGYSREEFVSGPEAQSPNDSPCCVSGLNVIDWPTMKNPNYHPILGSSMAYDIAYQHLYELLQASVEFKNFSASIGPQLVV